MKKNNLSWNDILSIELRNPKNEDVAALVMEIREQNAEIQAKKKKKEEVENRLEELEEEILELKGEQ